jgi:hypothetical protein
MNTINGTGMMPFTTARRLCSAASAVLLSFVLAGGPATAEIIPTNRTAPWQGNVGVPGGIPARTTIYKNIVTDLRADPTGNMDAAPIINRAILSCPAGQVVYMPAGTFKIATAIYSQNKSNYTLRGAGQGQTILKPTANNGISMHGVLPWPPSTNWLPISAGATKGSNVITITDTSAFAVNMPMRIGPNVLPTWAHNLGGFPDTNRTLGITFKVRSKTSTTVTFDPPLPFDFSGMNPMVLPMGGSLAQGAGFESFTMDMSNSTTPFPIFFENAFGCWISDVEIVHAFSRQMTFYCAIRCEVRHCYTHDVQGTGGPGHEGINFNTLCSWNLVEDNICDKGGAPPIEFSDAGQSCSANVAAYNYCVNTDPGFWDISFSHGTGGMLNLAEGNVIQAFKDDGYFGSSSYGTLFRNRITWQIGLKHFSNYYNIVGNVVGTAGVNHGYETETSDYYNARLSPVYELGFPNIGNVHHNSKFIGPTTPPDYHALPNTLEGCQQLDRNVKATLLRHGNFDYVNNKVIWDPAISDHTIPNSLYLSGKPSWWGNLPWPPIGPDKNPMVGTIPAQNRMLGVSRTPAPTATVPPTTAPRPSATPSSTQSPQVKKWKKKVKTGKWGRAKKNSGNQIPEGQEDVSH